MKQTIFKIICSAVFALSALLPVSAQEAFYIYRNDGQFNAFFNDEVDSIIYSKIALDSTLCDDYVVQEVYTTDSLYRIPLAAIDSVGFVKPETILNKNVVKLEDGLYDYLIKVNGMTLTFSSDLPKKLYPRKGDILICTDFNSSFFEEGFVGKVISSDLRSDGYQVECDSVNDIMEIFEQLISVERMTVEDTTVTRAEGIWETASIPMTLSLNYDMNSSAAGIGGNIYGALDGTMKVSVAYNITKESQFIGLTFSHGWALRAGMDIDAGSSFFKSGPAQSLTPAFRFPAVLPILKFQLMGAPFIRGEGKAKLGVSLNGPVHSYVYSCGFNNGKFFGENVAMPVLGDSKPDFKSALSLDGFVQGGYLLDLYLGTIKCLGYVKAAVDLYMGPKIDGSAYIDLNSAVSGDYYNTYKDSRVGLSLLSLDLEAYGEANYLGQTIMRHKFFTTSLSSYLYNEWYLMPDFSEISVTKSEDDNSVRLSCQPSRNVLFPLTLGLGLFDKDDSLLEADYNETEYKHDKSGLKLESTFHDLIRNKTYTARPMIKIFGGEIPASPTKEINLDVIVETLDASSITSNSAVLSGYADGLESAEVLCNLGICYGTVNTPTIENSSYVSSGRKSSGEFSMSVSELKPNTTYYYRTRLALDDKHFYGEIQSFTTKEADDPMPGEMIDLGLSVKWASHNVGASSPEGFGGYYAWGETEERSDYYFDTYKYTVDSDGDGIISSYETIDIGSNISGTQYDVAHVKWGGSWRMPTQDEIIELVNKCSWKWTTYNGVNGQLVTGPNGNSIFLPAAGCRNGTSVYYVGDLGLYWSAAQFESNSGYAFLLSFYSGGDYWDSWNKWVLRYCGYTVRPVSD